MKYLFLSILCCGLLLAGTVHAEEQIEFDDSAEIKPLEKIMSEQEALSDTELSNVDYGQSLPKLACNDENLKKQVANFIYSYINKDGTNSVIEQRARHLLVRNLHEFKPEPEKNLNSKNSYAAASAVAFLKINLNKEIYEICHSIDNNNKKFADLYAVIYRDGNYYKVVVPNMMISTKDIDDATFVYNW